MSLSFFHDPFSLVALLAMIAGMLMSLRQQREGLLLVWCGTLGYGAWTYWQQADLRFWLFAVTVTCLFLLAFYSEGIVERFDLRARWLDPNAMWGAIIGSMIGLFLFGGLEMLLLGIFLGAAIAESKNGFRSALRKGAVVFFSLLGGPGLRILAGCAIAGQFLAYYR